jgi:lauroyl/myristoyl acyltransferase
VYPELVYDAAAPRQAEVQRVAEKALRLFEQVIHEHPDQWHVLDPIWPTTQPSP